MPPLPPGQGVGQPVDGETDRSFDATAWHDHRVRFLTWNLCAGNTGAKLLRLRARGHGRPDGSGRGEKIAKPPSLGARRVQDLTPVDAPISTGDLRLQPLSALTPWRCGRRALGWNRRHCGEAAVPGSPIWPAPKPSDILRALVRATTITKAAGTLTEAVDTIRETVTSITEAAETQARFQR